MGSRKCGGCLSGLLILLALWSIIVNILLYFPNGQTSYASSNKLTNYVWYFEGICFSGIMMLIVAAVLLVLENDSNYKCCQSENCSKKYRTLLSMIFSALGIAFSGYCLVISALGLVQGPYCRTLDGWEYAFEGTAGRVSPFGEALRGMLDLEVSKCQSDRFSVLSRSSWGMVEFSQSSAKLD
ncbi:transmembrane 4 L6 family member 18 isoform X2 [Mirounga angustirostris]|uniref:transmembrane 4 L6 family member 18 isoform X2 n=1 Tax=Mirounga angustirostris TaxID=9716 RepID=UPI00313CAC95